MACTLIDRNATLRRLLRKLEERDYVLGPTVTYFHGGRKLLARLYFDNRVTTPPSELAVVHTKIMEAGWAPVLDVAENGIHLFYEWVVDL